MLAIRDKLVNIPTNVRTSSEVLFGNFANKKDYLKILVRKVCQNCIQCVCLWHCYKGGKYFGPIHQYVVCRDFKATTWYCIVAYGKSQSVELGILVLVEAVLAGNIPFKHLSSHIIFFTEPIAYNLSMYGQLFARFCMTSHFKGCPHHQPISGSLSRNSAR